MEISEILLKYDTDKNNGHHYGDAYDNIFSQFNRFDKLNILEIGIQKGGSLAAWREYFPNAIITGVDIKDEVTAENRRDDINYIFCDINEFKTEELFDIVIDDGSHWLKDVIHTVLYFSYKLKPNGIIIIEDVQNQAVWLPTITTLLHFDLSYNNGYNFLVEYMDLTDINNQADDFLILITNQKEV